MLGLNNVVLDEDLMAEFGIAPLRKLGLTSKKEAISKGYIRVKKPAQGSGSSGLWMAPENKQALLNKFADILPEVVLGGIIPEEFASEVWSGLSHDIQLKVLLNKGDVQGNCATVIKYLLHKFGISLDYSPQLLSYGMSLKGGFRVYTPEWYSYLANKDLLGLRAKLESSPLELLRSKLPKDLPEKYIANICLKGNKHPLAHISSMKSVEGYLTSKKGLLVSYVYEKEFMGSSCALKFTWTVGWDKVFKAISPVKTLKEALDGLAEAVHSGGFIREKQRVDALVLELWELFGQFMPEDYTRIVFRELSRELLSGGTLTGTAIETRVRAVLKQEAGQLRGKHVRALCLAELPVKLEDFYPIARSLGRKLHFISGPTNSGKTHVALDRLVKCSSGSYYGPLRLLALEVRDRLAHRGFATSLVTGELQEVVEGAAYSACTVEMADFSTVKDIAIIDETHLLVDSQRGSAWLQAILGIPAREVLLLGPPEIESVIVRLARELGEPLEITRLESFSTREVDTHKTGLDKIQPSSAVIAFSRKAVLGLAEKLRAKGHTVATIYGSLSPEVRKQQARLFSQGTAQVLVATDAIGLGLNLPIKHVLFSTLEKWNGVEYCEVDPHLVWQIAGRAGRYGFHETGHIGALDAETLGSLQEVMAHRPELLDAIPNMSINYPIFESVSRHLDESSLVGVFTFINTELRAIADYKIYISDEQWLIADRLDKAFGKLELGTRFKLSLAPVPLQGDALPASFDRLCQCLEAGVVCSLKELFGVVPRRLDKMEMLVKELTLYCWLHYRFPVTFPYFQEARQQMAQLDVAIMKELAQYSC